MFSDIYPSMHSDDLGPVIGTFNGNPVRSYDPRDVEERERRDCRVRVQASLGTSIPAEVLPGEVICKDSIIRRDTTAEAIGDAYYNRAAVEAKGHRVTIDEAAALVKSGENCNIIWRPDGNCGKDAYALVIEEPKTVLAVGA